MTHCIAHSTEAREPLSKTIRFTNLNLFHCNFNGFVRLRKGGFHLPRLVNPLHFFKGPRTPDELLAWVEVIAAEFRILLTTKISFKNLKTSFITGRHLFHLINVMNIKVPYKKIFIKVHRKL